MRQTTPQPPEPVDRLWCEREVVGRRVSEVARAVLAGLVARGVYSSRVSLHSIGIDYSRKDNDDPPHLYIEYDSLDL